MLPTCPESRASLSALMHTTRRVGFKPSNINSSTVTPYCRSPCCDYSKATEGLRNMAMMHPTLSFVLMRLDKMGEGLRRCSQPLD